MKPAALACLLLLLSPALDAQSMGATLLVLNKDVDSLSFIEPQSGRTIATVPTGENPHEVATTADGRFAIATNYVGSSLSVIDIAARKEVRRVSLPNLGQPHGIAPLGAGVVFTAEGDHAIAAYDPVAGRITWRTATAQEGTHMVTPSRDGRLLFASNMSSDTITILERQGDTWRPTHITVGSGPEGLDLTPDGRELWTTQFGDGAVSIIDVATKKVVQRVDVKTKRSNRIKFTRDGRYALLSDMEAGELVVVDAKSRAVTRRIPVGRSPEGILVPPAGDRVYVAVTGESRVVAIDVNTLQVVQTIATGRGPDGMAWVTTPRR